MMRQKTGTAVCRGPAPGFPLSRLHVAGPEAPELRLFCFPYAGGSGAVFRSWTAGLPQGVQTLGALLPGRGARLTEPPLGQMDALAEDLLGAMAPYLDRPFVFFGHSMGALIAYALCERLEQAGWPTPRGLIVSACRAPHVALDRRPTHDLSRPALIDRLRRLGGTPEALLDSPEMLDLVLPALRRDLLIAETWRCPEDSRIDSPIFAMGGHDDPFVTREHLHAWGDRTRSRLRVQLLPGGHFYLQRHEARFLQVLSAELERVIPSRVARRASATGGPRERRAELGFDPLVSPLSLTRRVDGTER